MKLFDEFILFPATLYFPVHQTTLFVDHSFDLRPEIKRVHKT